MGDEPQPPPAGSAKRRPPTWMAVVLAVAVGIGGLFWWDNREAAQRTEARERLVEALTPRSVRYCWWGSAAGVSVTIRTPSGGVSQASDKANNQCLDPAEYDQGEPLVLTVQNEEDTGTVNCRIEVDGRDIDVTNSSGAYVIATCRGAA